MNRYLVFARVDFAEPLEFKGAFEASGSIEEARDQAKTEYGTSWVELALVRDEQVTWIVGSEAEARGGQEVST